ncbi:hypothetical protein [Cerasicoccus fimbriatus]|uniref:hypothetical protein n=1 Tax=Cerasicoccus fimbriatus TaxID=3014554 RepID=UPI0022B400A9|nr:hypothetical protein [Cerasicoccus sp. TK19100]
MNSETISPEQSDKMRELLCALQNDLLATIIRERSVAQERALHAVAEVTPADTIYQIDKISEHAILGWFEAHWPKEWPVEIVMEGLEERGPFTFPTVDVSQTKFKCILDPIDGTRGIMYDKRSAWTLAGIAPQLGEANRLSDIFVAAMTELPTTKQWRADQFSVVHGEAIHAESINVLTGARQPLGATPSQSTGLEHGFATLCRFLPAGLELHSQIEAELWRRILPGREADLAIFCDQYITTGGQLYEIMMGRDRFIADVRPWVFAELGLETSLTCHPYDICVWPLAEAVGVIVEDPVSRAPIHGKLDTVSPVGWAAYANAGLRDLIAPHLQQILRDFCPSAARVCNPVLR